ncbi:MAG: DUF2147 domain-containing protein, partial [Bacteroidales bacterium]|nr:DUF2147 domain-containing protein [Bacteroidales bacterium]
MTKITIILLLLLTISVFCQAQADKIVGFYYAIGVETKEESQVEIYKNADGTYSGKIVWMKNPFDKNGKPKTDKKHPNKYWHNHSVIGMDVLQNFEYDEKKNCWNGRGYNPGNGKTYKSKITFETETRLKLRG